MVILYKYVVVLKVKEPSGVIYLNRGYQGISNRLELNGG